MDKIKLIATAAAGLDGVVKQEVLDLGYTNVEADNGRVYYEADLLGIARSNLWLRAADRVKWVIGEFKATTFEELFQQTKKLPWQDILPANASFPVLGRSVKSTLFSISDCQAIVKKAIVEKLKESYKQEWFKEEGPRFMIEVSLLKDIATITIDTSGTGLHKRGYRYLHNEAPMKETLAAGLILISRWKHNIPLIDPLCGSGTIPIEAAMIGQNIAPGINREFDFQHWPLYKQEWFNQAVQEAEDLAEYDRKLEILGADIDQESVKLSEHNAQEIGLHHSIRFIQQDVKRTRSQHEYGYIICNPPYGERLGEKHEVERLYQIMGRVFTEALPTWSYYVYTAHEEFEKHFNKKASKKRKLYSGQIRGDFYQFWGPRPPKEILDRQF